MEIEELLAELRERLAELKRLGPEEGLDLSHEIAELEEKLARARNSKEPDIWERVRLARHPERP
ncbi:MAG: acetyl-CoA carboxylase carboxyl transferase subunit alpha, partial [Candidatus Bipolaricaulia bacterium]